MSGVPGEGVMLLGVRTRRRSTQHRKAAGGGGGRGVVWVVRPCRVLGRSPAQPCSSAPPGGSIATTVPTCRAEAPPDPRGSQAPRQSVLLDRFCRLHRVFECRLLTASVSPSQPCWFRPHSLE